MLKTERKQLILEELNQHHVVSLEKLVSLLETSESTVRRDLDELEAVSYTHLTLPTTPYV